MVSMHCETAGEQSDVGYVDPALLHWRASGLRWGVAARNLTHEPGMNAFKLRCFHALVILQCVRWHCEYTISYRQIEEIMAECGRRG